MKWLSTTIKKKYMCQILSGEKTSEFKGMTRHWTRRIYNLMESLTYDRDSPPEYEMYKAHDIGINFLCGMKSYKFEVTEIIHHQTPKKIDGVKYKTYWEIKLGERLLLEE